MLPSLMMLAFAFLLAILIPLALSYFGWRSANCPVMGVKLALWLFLVDTFVPLPALPLGITIFAPDMLYLFLAMVGILRLFQIKEYRLTHWLWLILGTVMLGLFVVGTLKFKTMAGVEFRQVFAFWAGAMYLMTFQLDRKQVDDIFRAWVLVAAVMVPLVCFRWVAMALGLSMVSQWNEGGSSLRVVTASQALFLAQAFIIVYYARLRNIGPKWWTWIMPTFFCCVVVLQHRSVWVVTLVSVVLVYVLMPESRKLIAKQLLVGALLGIVLLGPLFASGKLDVVSDSLEHSVEETGSKKSTLLWRLQSTDALLGGWVNGGPLEILFGKPFGSGYERALEVQDNAKINVNPHNFFVLIILRGGGIGFLSLVAVYLISIRKFGEQGVFAGEIVETKLIALLLIGQLLYYMTYQPHEIEFVFVGLALTLGASMSNRKTAALNAPLKRSRRFV